MELHKSFDLGQKVILGLLVAFVLGAAGLAWFGYTRITELSDEVAGLEARLNLTSTSLSSTLAAATSTLARQIASETRTVQKQVGSLSGTLTTLQKLTQTDRELLAKYSKVFFLSDNYAPARLVQIPTEFRYDEKLELQLIPEVETRLEDMLNAAKKDDIEIYVQSAYRSFTEQTNIKNSYSVTYGAGTANTFSADQGYSEHQLGTTVDLITTGTKGRLEGFDQKPAYEWMQKNAYKYGFVLSYPKNNGYYIFEPWHWRYVGIKLATDLHDKDKYFYELDQRTIDTYLATLFD